MPGFPPVLSLSAPRRFLKAAGFTLIEILFVVVIMAGIATVVAVQVVGRLDSVKVSSAGKEIMAGLRYTRGQALLTQQAQALTLDVEKRTYTVPGREPVQLPENMVIELYTANQEISDAQTGSIRFYPDGGSTGGAVTLIYGERRWKIAVSWLTGDLSFEYSARPPRA